ncbi:Cannabidiolic acid synthase [Heracleum sosnowskyi]|uniref:Cannabidiolic acid synthase n=1 Tax=Heracleum sosnowskyi TaxID=360622 RepID=A0AAD8MZN8_9APIA|nr:Cannabidiolic acid synthase [Heracleum sosnowskyi]
MKIANNLVLSFAFLSIISLATSSQTGFGFLQCLARVSPNAESISEVIYTPCNSSYTSILQRTLQNLRFASSKTPKPLVIVTPVDESQIQTVIYCARKTNIQLRIRGTGHDFEGVSYVSQVPFVLLDMFNLRSVDVDPVAKTAWIQAGATLGEVYYAIDQKSKTLGFPAGVWSTVGATGLIGGGGYGILRRMHGLAADNVLDARMIDVNGRILDRKSMGEDLFWAIRGGGVSSFGVILSWTLKLVSVPEMMTLFEVVRTLEQNGTDIVHRWQTVAPKLPKEVEIRIVAEPIKVDSPPDAIGTVLSESSRNHQNGKTVRFRIVGSFLGRIDKLLPIIDQSLPELGLKRENCNQVSYIQAVLTFSLLTPETPPEALLERTSFKIPFKAKSDFVKQPISKQGLNGIWNILLQTEPQTTNLILTSYGGRMDEISDSSIPFPHRAGTLYMMYMRVLMTGDTTNALNWIRGLYSYLTPYTAPRTAYVNYNDFDLGVNNLHGPTSYDQASSWGKKYFKNNFDRLVQVKSKVDPTNFFRHEQSIPVINC